jgi:hypothetical protein
VKKNNQNISRRSARNFIERIFFSFITLAENEFLLAEVLRHVFPVITGSEIYFVYTL